MASNVWVFPALSVTLMDTVLPGAISVVPEMVGVVSFPVPSESKVRFGTAVLIIPLVVSDAEFPAASVAVAVTSKFPSAIALGTAALKLPRLSTIAVNVCSAPALSVTVMVTELPALKSVLPVIVGVVSLPVPCASKLIVGAVVSTLPFVSVAVVSLPAGSWATAVTVYPPSAMGLGTSAEKLPSP